MSDELRELRTVAQAWLDLAPEIVWAIRSGIDGWARESYETDDERAVLARVAARLADHPDALRACQRHFPSGEWEHCLICGGSRYGNNTDDLVGHAADCPAGRLPETWRPPTPPA